MNDADLAARYPILLGTPAICGAHCPRGWLDLVHNLLAVLEDTTSREAEPPRVDQIKEKFGGLRCYLSHETPEMTEAIRRAEWLSRRTCQECAEPGKQRDGGWIRTLCDGCARERELAKL